MARDLLGKVLVHRAGGRATAGAIVEVEAYIGEDDPACHAAPGPTRRNAPLYAEPGHAYVYLNYGVHCLMNAVTEPEGSPAAVLIRSLEPLEGHPLMRRRRGAAVLDEDLCRGPGNLTRAMAITLADNRVDLCGDRLYIEDRGIRVDEMAWGERIGISVGTNRPWRCFAARSLSISGRRRFNGARPR